MTLAPADLATELREEAGIDCDNWPSGLCDLLCRAADEIERLQVLSPEWEKAWGPGRPAWVDVLYAERSRLQARIAKLEAVAEAAQRFQYAEARTDDEDKAQEDLKAALASLGADK
jgi:hypothetical protein